MPASRPAVAAALAALVALSLVAPASAQQTHSDDTNAQVNAGAISIHDGLVSDFPTLALTGVAQQATAGMAPFEVRDLRGTGAGYTVTAQATAFAQHDGTAYVVSGRALPAGSLDYAGVTGVTADGTDSTAPAAGTGPFTVDADGAVQVASAAAGAGMGIFDFASSATAAMTLAVPGDAYAATYRSDVTLSLATGPTGSGETGTTSPAYVMQDVWTTQASMGTARHAFGAASDGQGRVYSIGGGDGNVSLASVERFDPATGTWATLPDMPGGARTNLAAATDGKGRVYAIGGGGTAALERFDPATGAWETLPPMPGGPRANLAAASDGQGRIYAIGGEAGITRTARVERFDPATGAWETLPDMPGGERTYLAAASDGDGRVYAVGGHSNTARLARVERFDPATGAWTTLPDMLGGARINLAAASDGQGRVYAIGGDDGAYTARVERFDPATGAWSALADMPGGGRGWLAAASDGYGRVYALGGHSGTGFLTRVERYE